MTPFCLVAQPWNSLTWKEQRNQDRRARNLRVIIALEAARSIPSHDPILLSGAAWGKARKRRPKQTRRRLLFNHGLGSRVHTRTPEADLVAPPGGNRLDLKHRSRANIGCETWLVPNMASPPKGTFWALKRAHMGTRAYVLAR